MEKYFQQLIEQAVRTNDLLSLLDQPLLLKPQVMAKLDIADSTYRAYVDEGKL
ncbi:hypothetical protein [Sphingobacterium lumbrici]|uniref:hypothetical protein n=1 Tax=Sphingobacterium lumbrici TaxID=2559600 RepID=UPI0015E27BF6|nr:hypothetical protein [Sphingobacterium lumbrici]